jgi:hypothetical protein
VPSVSGRLQQLVRRIRTRLSWRITLNYLGNAGEENQYRVASAQMRPSRPEGLWSGVAGQDLPDRLKRLRCREQGARADGLGRAEQTLAGLTESQASDPSVFRLARQRLGTAVSIVRR